VVQGALVVRRAANEWTLITTDIPQFSEEKVKLITATLQRHFVAVTVTDEVFYWQSCWLQDPTYPILQSLVPAEE